MRGIVLSIQSDTLERLGYIPCPTIFMTDQGKPFMPSGRVTESLFLQGHENLPRAHAYDSDFRTQGLNSLINCKVREYPDYYFAYKRYQCVPFSPNGDETTIGLKSRDSERIDQYKTGWRDMGIDITTSGTPLQVYAAYTISDQWISGGKTHLFNCGVVFYYFTVGNANRLNYWTKSHWFGNSKKPVPIGIMCDQKWVAEQQFTGASAKILTPNSGSPNMPNPDYLYENLGELFDEFQTSLEEGTVTANKSIQRRISGPTNALEYGIESIELLKSILSLRFSPQDISLLVKKLSSPASGFSLTKGLSNLYLQYTYGLPLFYADTENIATAFKKARKALKKKNAISATARPKGYEYHKTIYLTGSNQLDQVFRIFDSTVNPMNFWDLIPYSFVIDWFHSISDHLNLTPLLYDAARCLSHVESIKAKLPYTPNGTGRTDLYYRRVGRFGNLTNSVESELPSGRQIFTGSTLVVQRLH